MNLEEKMTDVLRRLSEHTIGLIGAQIHMRKLIKKETTKARIDELELAKISPKFKIEERIAQLQAELEEK